MIVARFTNISGRIFAVLILVLSAAIAGCRTGLEAEARVNVPKHNLWAWERPEDLRWLKDKSDIGVAFLAQTLTIKNNEVGIHTRRQPLRVSPGTFLTAVTRIETSRDPKSAANLSQIQIEKIRGIVVSNLKLEGVRAIQIDFDAAASERAFYTDLLESIKSSLPEKMPLSMTALASWCTGDRWISKLPVDEAVPMIFDMGTDDKKIRKFLNGGGDWPETLCRSSYGVAVYEEIPASLIKSRRFYHFSGRGWRESDLKSILEEK